MAVTRVATVFKMEVAEDNIELQEISVTRQKESEQEARYRAKLACNRCSATNPTISTTMGANGGNLIAGGGKSPSRAHTRKGGDPPPPRKQQAKHTTTNNKHKRTLVQLEVVSVLARLAQGSMT